MLDGILDHVPLYCVARIPISTVLRGYSTLIEQSFLIIEDDRTPNDFLFLFGNPEFQHSFWCKSLPEELQVMEGVQVIKREIFFTREIFLHGMVECEITFSSFTDTNTILLRFDDLVAGFLVNALMEHGL